MPDLLEQLRTYGRQLEDDLGLEPGGGQMPPTRALGDPEPLTPATPLPFPTPGQSAITRRRRLPGWPGTSVAAATIAIVTTLALALSNAPSRRDQAPSQGEDMSTARAVVTSVVTAFCVLGTSCSSGTATENDAGSTPPMTTSSAAPTTTSSSSSATSASPAARTALDTPGDLEAGTYLVESMPERVKVTVPAGWSIDEGGWLRRADKTAFVDFWAVTGVMADACVGSSSPVATPADFVDKLVAQQHTEATATPIGPTAGGIQVTRLDISTADLSTCTGGRAYLWSERRGPAWISEPGETWTAYVLDLNGTPGVLSAGGGPHDQETTAQIEAMVASVEYA